VHLYAILTISIRVRVFFLSQLRKLGY